MRSVIFQTVEKNAVAKDHPKDILTSPLHEIKSPLPTQTEQKMSFFHVKRPAAQSKAHPEKLVQILEKYQAIREKWIKDLEEYQAIAAKSPRDVETQLKVALTLVLLELYEDALVTYNSVLSIQNSNFSALYGCTRVLVALNRAEEAQEKCDRLLKIKPQDTSALALKNLIQTHLEKAEKEQKKAPSCRCVCY